ncbi:hypothetical protein JKP88DRAFT_263299 [Tribonema minus]|uniref:Tyrosine-protein phosphatase domain-containing protein n=1 Tax=Tribonema minus TaxID=303371 RepID=A0A836CE08_9STRA|nr:hypothetical protein JKP88DRAFT_263299 [Tribonema minus]
MATKLTDCVFIGDAESSQDPEFIELNKITHIINCAGRQLPNLWERHGLRYLTFPWDDTEACILFDGHANIVVKQITSFIDGATAAGESILVHSLEGTSRCVACAMSYLMYKFRWGCKKAFQYISQKRPDAAPNQGFIHQLYLLDERLCMARWGDGAPPTEAERVRHSDWPVRSSPHRNGKGGPWRTAGASRGGGVGKHGWADGYETDEEQQMLVNSFLNSQCLIEDVPPPRLSKDSHTVSSKIRWGDHAHNHSAAGTGKHAKGEHRVIKGGEGEGGQRGILKGARARAMAAAAEVAAREAAHAVAHAETVLRNSSGSGRRHAAAAASAGEDAGAGGRGAVAAAAAAAAARTAAGCSGSACTGRTGSSANIGGGGGGAGSSGASAAYSQLIKRQQHQSGGKSRSCPYSEPAAAAAPAAASASSPAAALNTRPANRSDSSSSGTGTGIRSMVATAPAPLSVSGAAAISAAPTTIAVSAAAAPAATAAAAVSPILRRGVQAQQAIAAAGPGLSALLLLASAPDPVIRPATPHKKQHQQQQQSAPADDAVAIRPHVSNPSATAAASRGASSSTSADDVGAGVHGGGGGSGTADASSRAQQRLQHAEDAQAMSTAATRFPATCVTSSALNNVHGTLTNNVNVLGTLPEHVLIQYHYLRGTFLQQQQQQQRRRNDSATAADLRPPQPSACASPYARQSRQPARVPQTYRSGSPAPTRTRRQAGSGGGGGDAGGGYTAADLLAREALLVRAANPRLSASADFERGISGGGLWATSAAAAAGERPRSASAAPSLRASGRSAASPPQQQRRQRAPSPAPAAAAALLPREATDRDTLRDPRMYAGGGVRQLKRSASLTSRMPPAAAATVGELRGSTPRWR